MRWISRIATLVLVVAASATGLVVLDTTTASAAAVVFTVNNLGDAGDATPGNGTCATAGAVCTLRAAIEEANAGSSANTYTIGFSLAGTVQIGNTGLPSLGRAITIDGSTTPGYTVGTGPTMVLRCASQTSPAYDALGVTAANVTIRALRIVNCDTGINSSAGAANLRVVGNQIGTDGVSFSAGNAVDIAIAPSGPNTVIGGPTAADRNVISGFVGRGITSDPTATGLVVQGNHIGTNNDGTAAIRNPAGNTNLNTPNVTGASMAISSAATGAQILGNVVSGNPGYGVTIVGGTAAIKGNRIGTDAAGTVGLGNFGYGILAVRGTTTMIGGTGAGEGNVIADARTVPAVSSLANGRLVSIYGATATIQGNKIGTNAAGTARLGAVGDSSNQTAGIYALASGLAPGETKTPANVTIGGTAAGAGNVVSGSYTNIRLQSYPGQTLVSTATIQGNLIGTNATGTAALAGSQYGILGDLFFAATIGGGAAGAGNVVSGNVYGIELNDNQAGIVIQGNKVGTNAAGTAAVPNTREGVSLIRPIAGTPTAGGPLAKVGGSAPGEGNLLSGNGLRGFLMGSAGMVQGNRIGTNAAGTAAIPNSTANSTSGAAVILNNPSLVFGGSGPGEGNLVSGNTGSGVEVNNPIGVVHGNLIGTNAAGTGPVPNGWAGIAPSTNAVGAIGGVGAGEGNTIAYNGHEGVFLPGGTAVAIRGNRIHSNGTRNIELRQKSGPTNAGNHDQIHPTITSITAGASTTAIAGTVSSDQPGPVLVDVYGGSACQSAYATGEARQYLGTISVPYAGGGVVTAFSGSVANSTVGSVITATATVAANGTSQFSTCLPYSDLEVTAVDSQERAAVGDDVATLFTVKNNGSAAANGVVVPVRLNTGDLGFGFFAANDEGWFDAPSQGAINGASTSWTIGTLAPGASATLCARGDIVRGTYIYNPDDFPISLSAYFAPAVNANAVPGVADPYGGNNAVAGGIDVGAATARNSVCPLPTLSIADASLTRPASGTSPMTFTVTLSKAQTRPVTVRYATSNGKAVAVEDYVATAGDLTFAAGETSKTVTVPIVGNQSDEPDKAFNVTLSAPKHALLGDGTAIGTVKANFALGGCPPGSTSVQRFVCHLYFDALGRTPDASGFNYWVGKLNRGTPRSTMAASYLVQPESLRKVANRAYVLYLGRNGTNAELSAWATKLKAKTATTQDIRISVLASAEYFTKTGGTNTLYIQQMFRDVFRRNVDASGLAYWTGQLANGKTRTNVATRFMAEPEGRRKIVGDIYLRFLRRDPTTAEATGWVDKLASGKTEVDVGIGLVASTEYYNRPQN